MVRAHGARGVYTCSFIRFLEANNSNSPHLQFGLLTDVTELNLGLNEITGTLPSEIGCMTKLVTGGSYGFVLSNQLTGTVPTELGNVDQMTRSMV